MIEQWYVERYSTEAVASRRAASPATTKPLQWQDLGGGHFVARVCLNEQITLRKTYGTWPERKAHVPCTRVVSTVISGSKSAGGLQTTPGHS